MGLINYLLEKIKEKKEEKETDNHIVKAINIFANENMNEGLKWNYPTIRTCINGHSWLAGRVHKQLKDGSSASWTVGVNCPICKRPSNMEKLLYDSEVYRTIYTLRDEGLSFDQIVIHINLTTGYSDDVVRSCLDQIKRVEDGTDQ